MPTIGTPDAGAEMTYESQPPWGEAPSDSLQYELFFADRFLSIRALKFPSCQFISAWMFDEGVSDLFSTSAPLTASQADLPGLHAQNECLSLKLGARGGQINIASRDHGAFEVDVEETVSTIWRVPLGDIVIHQPLLNVALRRGSETWSGVGYAKRYTFEEDTRHTYWRFITGPTSEGQIPGWLWTAEAAFDLKKYDYFKLAEPEGTITAADQPGSWHRDRMAHGVLGGVAHQVEIEDLGRIERSILGPGTNLKLSQAFCRMSLTTERETRSSFALNEIACGSHT